MLPARGLTPLLLCAAPGAAHSLGKGVSGAAAAARVATIPWNSLTGVCLNGAVGPGAQQDRGSIYFLISRVSTAGQGNPRERGCAQGGGGRGGRWGTNTGSAALGWAMGWGGGPNPCSWQEPPCLGGLLDDCCQLRKAHGRGRACLGLCCGTTTVWWEGGWDRDFLCPWNL